MSGRGMGGAAVTTVVLLVGCSSGSSTPSRTTTTTRKASTTTSSTTTPGNQAVVPLYPFANLDEVAQWQQAYAANGTQADRLDASATALGFAHFLGYTDVDRVIGSREDSAGMHVSVGFRAVDTTGPTVSAVVHLIRYGSGKVVPWEVVGTDDTDFSIDSPTSGASVASPLQVSGTISGVDESITVHVQQLHANGYLGTTCCIPGGGQASPWALTVTFSAPTDPVVIISASTGGHVRDHERFTVVGASVAGT
ncbi:MAG: hypothetical protein ACXVJ7_11525 [Acidimicrobiia bacterium]